MAISRLGMSGAAASKAVHITVFPHPENIRESRELLRVLQTFGEMLMFKSYRVWPYPTRPL